MFIFKFSISFYSCFLGKECASLFTLSYWKSHLSTLFCKGQQDSFVLGQSSNSEYWVRLDQLGAIAKDQRRDDLHLNLGSKMEMVWNQVKFQK